MKNMEKEIEDLLSEMKAQMKQLENRLNQLEKKIKPTETENFVDLGLSVQWATCNVGANIPEGYGDFFGWEEAKKLSNSEWQVPTIEQLEELLENCDYKWTTQNGVKGGLFTSKINGNSIFLPAAGFRIGSDVYDVGSYGYYWSSSASSYYDDAYYYLYFNSGDARMGDYDRYYGHSVRLVRGL